MESKNKFTTEHKKYDAIIKGVNAVFLFLVALIAAYILLTEKSERSLFTLIVFSLGLVAFISILYSTLKKQVRLEFDDNSLMTIHRITGTIRTIELRQIEGFKSREFESRSGVIREIILIKDGKPFLIISSADVVNFKELRDRISNSLKYLGAIKFDMWQQVVSIFKG